MRLFYSFMKVFSYFKISYWIWFWVKKKRNLQKTLIRSEILESFRDKNVYPLHGTVIYTHVSIYKYCCCFFFLTNDIINNIQSDTIFTGRHWFDPCTVNIDICNTYHQLHPSLQTSHNQYVNSNANITY